MKKALILATIIVGLVSFIYILNSFSASEVFDPFKNASLWAVLGFIAVSFLISCVLTLKWYVINKSMGINIPFWHLYFYRLAGYCISYVTPGPRIGGEPVMANLLKKRGVDYVKSLSAMLVDKTFDASSSGITFVIGVLAAITWLALPSDTKYLMILIAAIFCALIIYFYSRMLQGKDFLLKILSITSLDRLGIVKKYRQKIVSFEKISIRFYKKEKTAFVAAAVLAFTGVILTFFEYFFVLKILGQSTSVLGIFLMVSFVGIALLLPIPAAIGSLEAGQVFAASLNSLKSSIGLGVSFIIRARDVVWVSLGFLLLAYFGFDIKRFFRRLFRRYIRINKNVKVYLQE